MEEADGLAAYSGRGKSRPQTGAVLALMQLCSHLPSPARNHIVAVAKKQQTPRHNQPAVCGGVYI
ncbi:MAG: hypothetical protein ACM3UY_09845 [Methanocella sp.]